MPHRLIHQIVDVRLSATTVEVFQRGTRIWVHRRRHQVGGFTTVAEHMPHAHRAHLEWTPSRLIRWAATVGAQTAVLVEQILASRPHPEQGYRSCLGLLRLTYRSTIITSQLPIDRWHEHLGDPTVADAILDRVVHRAHRLALTGPSRRKDHGTGSSSKDDA